MFEERAEFAERIIRNGKLDENRFISQTAYIIRYMRYLGKSELEVVDYVKKLLYDIRGVPSRPDMMPYIDTARRMVDKMPPMNTSSLVFSRKELEFIHEASDEKFETFVFVFFCIYKYYKRSDRYFVLFKDVFRESRVGGHKEELNKFINNNPYFEVVIFHSQDYLVPTEYALSLMEEESEPELVINNFINIRYYYLQYFGYARFFNCEVCGVLDKKIKNNQKYCRTCARKMNIIKTNTKRAENRALKKAKKITQKSD